jgi:hypothetical protein
MKRLFFLTLLIGLLSCSKSDKDPGPDDPVNTSTDPVTGEPSSEIGKGQPGVVGLSGIDAWG